METSDLFALRQLIVRLFAPLEQACASPDAATRLLAELGYIAPTTVTAFEKLSPTLDALEEIFQTIDNVSEDANDDEVSKAVLSTLDSLNTVINGINGLGVAIQNDFAGSPILTETDIVAELSRKLFDYLVAQLLETYYTTLNAALNLFGIIETETLDEPQADFEAFLVKRTIHWDRLPQLFQNPIEMLVANLTTGDEVLIYRALFYLNQLALSFGLPSGFRSPDEPVLSHFNDGADLFAREDADQLVTLRFPFTDDPEIDAGLDVYPLMPAGAGNCTGLALAIRAGAQLEFPISERYKFQIKAGADTGNGLGLRLPRHGDFTATANIFNSPTEIAAATKFSMTFSIVPADTASTDKLFSFGATDGTRLDIGSGSLTLGVEKTDALNLFVEADLKDGVVAFKSNSDDGFLSHILPADGIQAAINFGVGISNTRGLYFKGGDGISIQIPLHLQLGPIEIQRVGIAIAPADDAVALTLTAVVATTFGPFFMSVEDIGVQLIGKTSSDRTGNLGPLDVSSRFKAPNGLGIVVDAPSVVGGGFLRFDDQKGEYSGVLELKIADKISVKGVALLTTKLPGGGKGFAFVIIIFVEGFQPIPLGLGFKLTGIGGLLAINRTFDENALRAGLKEHTLDSIMFPKDPIRNAPQILGDLSRVFPPALGHHLFGPMVQISWGTPTLITIELALVLEFGQRLRLLMLAQIAAILPDEKNDLVHLQLDAIGIIDFDQGTASLDATLHDSRLLKKFVLTGDMAMRLKWQSGPSFALAVGGLHPAFNPPPNFPKLERIAINLASGDNPRLRCESYFAITSNTVQFGARAELYAAAAGFSVHGDIGYDVLIQFDPFFFIADFHAQLQLKRGSTNLFKVSLEGQLSGPRPLHIKGKATFEILWWDYSIRIDKTLVEGEKPPLPAPVDVLPLLQSALENPGNWVGQLPTGRPVATLREHAGATDGVRLHPLGSLTVKQTVVPLNFEISQFGQSVPSGANRFSLAVDLVGHALDTNTVTDFFARSQFVKLTDDEKLSAPSFESMDAGITMSSDDFSFSTDATDWIEVSAVEFETWIVDDASDTLRRSESELPKQPSAPVLHYQLSALLFTKQARFGAAANSTLRRAGNARYRITTTGKYQTTRDGWTIITEDLQPTTKPTTYSQAIESLQTMRQQDPAKAAGLKLVRLSEILKNG